MCIYGNPERSDMTAHSTVTRSRSRDIYSSSARPFRSDAELYTHEDLIIIWTQKFPNQTSRTHHSPTQRLQTTRQFEKAPSARCQRHTRTHTLSLFLCFCHITLTSQAKNAIRLLWKEMNKRQNLYISLCTPNFSIFMSFCIAGQVALRCCPSHLHGLHVSALHGLEVCEGIDVGHGVDIWTGS